MKKGYSCVLILVLLLVTTACSSNANTPVDTPDATKEPTLEPTLEPTPTPTPEPTRDPDARYGGWLDMIIVVEEPSPEVAVAKIESGDLDIYASKVTDIELFKAVKNNPNLAYSLSITGFNTLMFNPEGPVFEGSGRFNPFSVPKIREAMNYLVDRGYIVEEILGGLGAPNLLPLTYGFPDYKLVSATAEQLVRKYAHNPEKAVEMIDAEMLSLGAIKSDGIWTYDGEPVEIIILIQVDDKRLAYGEYIADVLEDIGFTVNRQYKTAEEASAIWNNTHPSDGQWHIYITRWINLAVSRDQGWLFDFLYSSWDYWWFPIFYKPDWEFEEIAFRLLNNDFTSIEERKELISKALPLALQDSIQIILTDNYAFTPYNPNVEVSAGLAGVVASTLWPYTLRWIDQEGGTMMMGVPDILSEPWNPVGGTNLLYDLVINSATADAAVLSDPQNALNLPQRLTSAQVYIQEGLPVGKTLDWVSLEFVPEIVVPDDAWVDWDAETQTFVTVGEEYPRGLTAYAKVVCNYQDDLYETQWHDGSYFSIGDVVLAMIINFDRAKEASTIYDESTVPINKSFMWGFKGWRIVSEDPLIVEYYTDVYALDAEYIANDYYCGFPNYGFGTSPWHMVALGILAEANKDLAFSQPKAEELGIEWMSYISGPSLEILSNSLETAAAENYIPYAPTLSQYISEEEAAARWANYADWYRNTGHFWVGNGPYYIFRVFPDQGTIILKHFPAFPDPADKWLEYPSP